MNVIQVKFDIDIDNNEQISAFNTFVGALKNTGGIKPVVTAQVADIKPKTQAPVETANHDVPGQPVTTAQTPAAQGTQKLDIIRGKMAPKLGTHREAIKAKFVEMKAPNLTELPVDRWVEFEQFIDGLA